MTFSIKKRPPSIIFISFLAFIICFASLFGISKYKNYPSIAKSQYSAHQAFSFLHGRLDIFTLPNNTHDLSYFNGKAYAYWPPLTALIMVPLVAITGPSEFPQRIFAIFLSSLNCAIFSLIAHFIIPKTLSKRPLWILFAALVFSLGTSNAVFAIIANHWFLQQLTASTFLLLTLFFLFKFNDSKRFSDIFLSLLFLAISSLGRFHLILLLPSLLGFWIFMKGKEDEKNANHLTYMKPMLLLIIPVSVVVMIIGVFNYLRFDSFYNFGIQYQNFQKVGGPRIPYLQLHYIKNNIMLTLFPNIKELTLKKMHTDGFSILIQCPFLLLIYGGQYSSSDQRLRNFLWAAMSVVIVFIMCFAGTGQSQFGARYLHDVVPIASVLTLQHCSLPQSGIVTISLAVLLGIASIAINLWGSVFFLSPL